MDCKIDHGNQEQHRGLQNNKDRLPVEVGSLIGQKFGQVDCTRIAESKPQGVELRTMNGVSAIARDTTGATNVRGSARYNSENHNLLKENLNSSSQHKNMKYIELNSCNLCRTIYEESGKSCDSVYRALEGCREEPVIDSCRKIHNSKQGETNKSFCIEIQTSEQSVIQNTQTGYLENIYVGVDTKSDKINSNNFETSHLGEHDSSNRREDNLVLHEADVKSQNPLTCHMLKTEKNNLITSNGNIEMEENEHNNHHNKNVIHTANHSFEETYHTCLRKEPPTNEDYNTATSPAKDTRLTESFCTKYSSCRWKLAYLCFLARFIQTALRQCMGIAIIGMTLTAQVGELQELGNTTDNSTEIRVPEDIPEFQWGSAFEGVILASFNMGSIITPIVVGYLSTRHDKRKLMTVCLLGGGISTVLLPVAAKADPALIIVFRIITGISLSGTDSLIQAMWAQWAPLYEKASLSACAYTGLSTAGVLTFLVCGYIVSIGGEGKGWPYIFYIFGFLCLLLVPLWFFTVHDRPESHPGITRTELAIITFNKQLEPLDHYKQETNTPWRRILKSSAVWVVVMGHVTHKWILSFMLSYLPRYFSDMFNFDMKTDGLFSSLPFAGRVLTGVIAGYVSDWMLRRGVSTQRTRKFFQAAGCWGCAVCSLLIALIPSLSSAWSISLLVLALSCQDLTSVAFRINLLDIAPRYAGLLNGFASTIATVASLPAPIITSMLISGGSVQGWQILFCLVAALNISGGVIFVIFAKGEIQDWAQASYLNPNIKPEDEVVIFTLEASNQTTSVLEQGNHTALREVKSLPGSSSQNRTHRRGNEARRATFDVGSLIKSVQNNAFINLALADL